MLNEEAKAAKEIDSQGVMLVHTVMFYGLLDEKAPVYGNDDLQAMRQLLLREKDRRETWYFPESAYWVTFDINVPMLLLPYLSERLEDIEYVSKLNVPGHVTFSSGWEWGYWLIDWSIARWSWEFSYDGQKEQRRSNQYFEDLFGKGQVLQSCDRIAALQEEMIKDEELIRYMVGVTITDELPAPLDMAFHPRPKDRPKYLARKAKEAELNAYYPVARMLADFNDQQAASLGQLQEALLSQSGKKQQLLQEIIDGLEITGLRAAHRGAILSATIAKRKKRLKLADTGELDWKQLLDQATVYRKQGLEIVERRRKQYRYDLHWMDAWRRDHTAYKFGYLYTVKDLHFWLREEQQLMRNRYGPFFMNIWDVWRISGIL